MIHWGKLLQVLYYLLTRTSLRVLTVEGLTRLSMRSAELARKEISMYRAYHASRPVTPPIKLSSPQRSALLFKNTELSSSTSHAFLRSRTRRWFFVGVTMAQSVVAWRWPLEDYEDSPSSQAEEDEGSVDGPVGLVVKSPMMVDISEKPVKPPPEASEPAMIFWDAFAEDFRT